MGNTTQTQPVVNGAAQTDAAATQTQQTQTAQPWYHDFADPDLRGYAENKKWASSMEAVKGARDAEKLLGVPKEELIRLPKDAKPEDWNGIYDRLGRPKAPTDYKLPTVEGGEEFAAKMAPLLHSAGLNQQQVDLIANGWNTYMKAAVEAQDTEQQQKEQVDLQTLHREWPGKTFDERQEMARRGVREFVSPHLGGDQGKMTEALGKMEDALGTALFLKIWAGVGEKVSESKFVDGVSRGTFGMTPDGARVKRDELLTNKEFGARFRSGDKAAISEMDRLDRIIAGV